MEKTTNESVVRSELFEEMSGKHGFDGTSSNAKSKTF